MSTQSLQINYHGLIPKGLRPFNTFTSNHADTDTCHPHVCCAWMDLHTDTDYGVTPEQPYFVIRPLYWDTDASLVVTDESGRLVIVERTGDLVRFNGTKPHGLVPQAVAQKLVSTQTDTGPLYMALVRLIRDGQFPPKMVWDWVEPSTYVPPIA